MLNALQTHSEQVQTVVNIILMLVWVLYLNLFFVSLRRSRKPMILLSRSAGSGPEANLFISNMGAEPIYLSALIADCDYEDGQATAFITRNDHIGAKELSSPDAATNEGPLKSGEYLNAGSSESLMTRIELHADRPLELVKVERITLTVVAATGHSALISAASNSYRILRIDGDTMFHPERTSTTQHTGMFARRRIRARLTKQLDDEMAYFEQREAERDRPGG